MNVELTDTERAHLRQLQKQRRDEECYVKITVLLMLNADWIAEQRGLDDGTVYRYAQAWQHGGVEKYLVHAPPSYWDLLPSAKLVALSRQAGQTLCVDVRTLWAWLRQYWGVDYSVLGLTQLLHRLGFRLVPELRKSQFRNKNFLHALKEADV